MGRNISVLHLLPHCGGGVGAVLRALLKAELSERAHTNPSIVSLERLNEITRDHFNSLGISWIDCIDLKNGSSELADLFRKADIVLVHWWNHPLLMRLLYHGLPPARLAFWSHVNGFADPQSFFPELFELPDRFIFATKASLQSPVAGKLSNDTRQNIRVIRSCAGIPMSAAKPSIKDKPFRYGYVGTVEPAKMHRKFLELCAAAQIQSRCIVAGGPAHNELRLRAEYLGIGDLFEILGPVDDPEPIFRRLHAFAYPLNPSHYGSGEQALIEAMAYGAVPVVLDNPPEKALVRHGETGLIAHTPEEFAGSLRFLADNPAERVKLSEAGRQFVLDECDIKIFVNDFLALYEEMITFPKRPRKLRIPIFDGIADGSPFHLFLASCGNETARSYIKHIAAGHGDCLLPPEFSSETRGTPQHYLRLLGHDPVLELVCKRYLSQTGTAK